MVFPQNIREIADLVAFMILSGYLLPLLVRTRLEPGSSVKFVSS